MNYQSIEINVSLALHMFDDAPEDIEFFKSVVKDAYFEYVKETTAPSVRG